MKKPSDLIKEVKYARKLHVSQLAYHIKEQKDQKAVIKEKDFIIKVLGSKKLSKKDVLRAKKIIKKWQQTHADWIDHVKKNPKWSVWGGSITWQKRWLKTYQDILDYLQKL